MTKNDWINVNFRFPDSDDQVLITDGKNIFIGWRTKESEVYRSYWKCHQNYDLDNITHWQALPALPKILSQAQLCALANFTTDQMESMGAEYKLINSILRLGWHFKDGSIGYYNMDSLKFIVIE